MQRLLATLSCLLVVVCAFSQTDDIKARILFRQTDIDSWDLKATVVNVGEKDQTIDYLFSVKKTDRRGRVTIEKEEGSTMVVANEKNDLAESSIRTQGSLVGTLKIFQAGQIIAKDTVRLPLLIPQRAIIGDLGEQVFSGDRMAQDIEFGDLFIDDTRTPAGRIFYEMFYRDWEAPPKVSGFTINIEDAPFQGTNIQVKVKLNDVLIFDRMLTPKPDFIEELAKQAIGYTQYQLANFAQLQKDLGGEDVSGSGIY